MLFEVSDKTSGPGRTGSKGAASTLSCLGLSCNKEFQEGSQGLIEILPRDAIPHFKT